MDEVLWAMTQQSRVLQELRREIQPLWDDEASREINSRYLNPHEDDDRQMLSELAAQKEALDQTDASLAAARAQAVRADELAAEVRDWLGHTEEETNNSYTTYDLFVRYNSSAAANFPTIKQLINDANGTCE